MPIIPNNFLFMPNHHFTVTPELGNRERNFLKFSTVFQPTGNIGPSSTQQTKPQGNRHEFLVTWYRMYSLTMELMVERAHITEANPFEWPKVPQSNIESKEIPEERLEVLKQHGHKVQPFLGKANRGKEEGRAPDQSDQSQPRSLKVNHPSASAKVEEATKRETAERWNAKLGLFGLRKAQWPDPHLSIGTKCNQLGGNECWKTIGPAQELFELVSKSIGDLLDARVEDLEEGEPLAGHILLFDMYMVGKSATTAQPTLLFTCQRPKPRRRAIKFVKESGILKGHPKVIFAESSIPPLATGTSYLRLLAGLDTFSNGDVGRGPNIIRARPWPSSMMPKRDPTPTSSSTPSGHLSSSWVVGPVFGSVLGLVTVLVVIYFTRRKHFRESVKVVDRIEMGVKGHRKKPSDTSVIREFDTSASPYTHVGSTSGASANQKHCGPNCFPGATLDPIEISKTELNTSSDNSNWSSHGTFGIPILCKSNRRRATIGEIICLNEKYYGVTVAHLFDKSCTEIADNDFSLESQETDAEFAFISDDEEELGQIDSSDIAITSQGMF
jgi:hypothetical protein